MHLYFTPMTCSLATRIALYEAGIPASFDEVTLATKRLTDGTDYLTINPKGQVPALRTSDGVLLTENAAVLQYVADVAPQAATDVASELVPTMSGAERVRLQEWLSYVGTEVHKAVFYTVFHPASPPEAKAFARDVLLPPRFDYLAAHLADRETLLAAWSVADAYLFTTLCWAETAGVDLARWPTLVAYRRRMLARPMIAKAVAEERALRAEATSGAAAIT
jgi:glutathione S-transferase